MKNITLSLALLVCALSFAVHSFASHVRDECKYADQGELKYSVMFNLPHSQNGTNDSSVTSIGVLLGIIMANEEMQQTRSDGLAASLVEHIENLIGYESRMDVIVNGIESSILAKMSKNAASRLLANAADLNKKNLINADVNKILMELQAKLIKRNFEINAGLEDAIENQDEQKLRQYLKAAGYNETTINQSVAALSSGCHESVSFFDYDAKGNAR